MIFNAARSTFVPWRTIGPSMENSLARTVRKVGRQLLHPVFLPGAYHTPGTRTDPFVFRRGHETFDYLAFGGFVEAAV
jgi:hypothetical protein